MKKQKLVTLIGTALLTLAATTTVFAGTWKQDHVGWWWQRNDGSYPVNGWEWIDANDDSVSECYYFNSNGYCLLNTTTPDGYQVDINGAWVNNGVVQTKKDTDNTTAVSTSSSGVQPTRYTFTEEQILSFTPEFLYNNNKIEDCIWKYDYLKSVYELGLQDKALWNSSPYTNGWISIAEEYSYEISNPYRDLSKEMYSSLDAYIQYHLKNLRKQICNMVVLFANTSTEIEGDILRAEEFLKEYEWDASPYCVIQIWDKTEPFMSEEEINGIFNRIKERMNGSNGIYLLQSNAEISPREESVYGGQVYVRDAYMSILVEYTNSRDCYENRAKYRGITD
ncbi:MAG: hypothetical protein IJ374_05620 [Lachnospiraceae bacterium]|nr:hypothetical protein [Lachnospiraceae bacterium]